VYSQERVRQTDVQIILLVQTSSKVRLSLTPGSPSQLHEARLARPWARASVGCTQEIR